MSILDSFSEACVRQEACSDGRSLPWLRGLLSYSRTGKLVAAAQDGGLLLGDVREELAVQAGQAHRDPAGPHAAVHLHPHPALGVDVQHLSCSPCGTLAAVAGTSRETPELSELWALAWHPLGDGHLAVLTSDAAWRLYCLDEPSVPEQTLELSLGSRHALGLGGSAERPTAFAFGPAEAWDRFALYFLSNRSNIFRVCPVVPFGCRVPSASLAALGEDLGEADEATHSWLQRAFAAGTRSGVAMAQRHALGAHVPVLVGPLRVATPGEGPLPAGFAGLWGDSGAALAALPGEAEAQWERVGALREALAGCEARAAALTQRADAALRLQDVLNERCALLAALHWRAGACGSRADAAFERHALPRLEAGAAGARREADALAARGAALARRGVGTSQAALAVTPPLIGHYQLRRLREGLARQEAGLSGMLAGLGALERALAQAGA
ncbi:hypothetical protein F751_5581 [Auxenochlorella protothecoides]|uniref:Nuclear pore complex protein NUP88 n=1 Tax=Auxenochlorella protothecoides TaxID=3075 RepID=A0A087SAW8_AUXPR|nr:hypothetical protein F751_5581 [Auxenochlorella protothecoides]KFM22872.1 hypothetical protein F751_5581 [Auxenochlorella protothecoides]